VQRPSMPRFPIEYGRRFLAPRYARRRPPVTDEAAGKGE